MPRRSSVLVTACFVLTVAMAAQAEQISGPPRGSARVRLRADLAAAVPESPPHQHGGTLVADSEGLWVAERVPGVLIRTDREGQVQSTLSLHPGLGELVHDAADHVLFVADRGGDRVLRIDSRGEPKIVGELAISEPHGLALTPDGATLLVTSIADHELVALDARELSLRWRVELLAEPRGVAISPEGNTAVVGFLSSGALAEVDLASAGKSIRWHALDPRDPVEITTDEDDWGGESVITRIEEANSRFEVPNDVGRRRARNVFALAFVGDALIAPHQLAISQMERRPEAGRRDSYGGGAEDIPPIVYQLARIESIARPGASEPSFVPIFAAQPRALVWDPRADVLYVGGYGDDRIEAFSSASHPNPTSKWAEKIKAGGCGIDGLALAPEGTGLWVHCELTRTLIRVDFGAKQKDWLRSPELVASVRSPEVDHGAELFRRDGDERISGNGDLACANCHPEGRSDGLSWRLGKSILQTPILAGRVADTAPYKWDGQDANLRTSIRHTTERLGGTGAELRRAEVDAIDAYLRWLAAPRAPTPGDAAALARGRTVFEAECSGCHAGEHTTDRTQHALTTSLAAVDTPSLTGLAHSAPYYHDGSATDLRALLDDRATVHDMTDTSKLSKQQREDIITYLESL